MNTGYELRGEGSPEERPRKAFIEEFIFGMDFKKWGKHSLSQDGRTAVPAAACASRGRRAAPPRYGSSAVTQDPSVTHPTGSCPSQELKRSFLSSTAAALRAAGTSPPRRQAEPAGAPPREEVGEKIRQSLFLSSL